MSATFNTLDLIFIAFALIFIATGFFRGFVKEVFSLIGWLLAFVGSYFLTPFLADVINIYSRNKILSDILARSGIFIIILLTYTFSISSLVSDLKEKMPRSFDCSLGVLYGLIKTTIVFGFLYSVAMNALEFVAGKPIPENSAQYPKFLKEAKCHDIMKGSADVLNPAVKLFFDDVVKNFDSVIPKRSDDLEEKIDEIVKDKKSAITEDKESLTIEEDSGYEKKDIQKMNHLIEIIDKK